MNRWTARLLDNRPEGPDAAILAFSAPRQVPAPLPGQFFMVKLLDGGFPLFGRALAVLDCEEAGDHSVLRFLVKRAGKGTERLLGARGDAEALLVGPAGNSFPDPPRTGCTLLVAGGTGLAAFYYGLKSRGWGKSAGRLLVLYGARDRASLYLHERVAALGAPVLLSTDDGSLGAKGFVSELLAKELERPGFPGSARIYACGPDPMMKAVSRISFRRNLETYLSLETRMACGIGVCNGCAVEVVRDGKKSFERVCYEGPVFPARLLPGFLPREG